MAAFTVEGSRRLPKCLNFVSVSLFQCCTGQNNETVNQTFRQPMAAFTVEGSRRLPKCLNFVSVSLFQCCTGQNNETVIQTFRQPMAAFTDCINLYIVFSSL